MASAHEPCWGVAMYLLSGFGSQFASIKKSSLSSVRRCRHVPSESSNVMKLSLLIIAVIGCVALSVQAQESSSRHRGDVQPISTAKNSAPAAIPPDGKAVAAEGGPSVPTSEVGKTSADPSPSVVAPKVQPDDLYKVGIDDELQISVWKEPDLSVQVVVRPDGIITIPVVDDVPVVGLTTKQVADILTDKLKNVVAEPQVTVIVRKINSRKVYLTGQVGRPGAVSLTGHETALQVIAESGGLNIYAKAEKIYILRKADGRQQKLPFNYKKAINGEDPKSDIALENGDVIVVP